MEWDSYVFPVICVLVFLVVCVYVFLFICFHVVLVLCVHIFFVMDVMGCQGWNGMSRIEWDV